MTDRFSSIANERLRTVTAVPAGTDASMEEMAGMDRRNWIAGLEKGLAIIQAFDIENSRLTASSVARLTGLTRSAARRHLMTLTYLGFTATDGKSFWLMPKVLRLGTAYLYSARLPRVVQPFLQRLTGATQESAFVAILDDDDVVYIARNGANRVMNVGFVLGARISPFVSSAGIALLSAEPRQRTTTLLERYETKPHTPHTITDKGELFALVERAALQGYATLEQQLEPGVRGIAVPLKNHRAETVGAISISARIGNESSEDALRRLLVPLQQLAFELREVV